MNLLFGVHNHQPVGNFPGVFEKASHFCYRPFIEALYNYPQVKATLHFSGSLIDWLLENDPGLLAKVKEMVKRAQVDILSGGYFEPILPIIPERDRLGQINMLSSFIRDYFQYQPQGMWLAERVWHPELITSLSQAGLKYTLLDDFHFRYAGIKQEDLSGYYTSEAAGHSLAIFPISKELRYTIPFSVPTQPIDYLKGKAKAGAEAAIIVDDGEKFGLWPGTYKWVYEKKWLEKFFQLLRQNQDWLKTVTISEYMSTHQPLGACQLPPASYEEMMSWCGGSFENFFSKYPEANNLHKRMLYVSERVSREKPENHEAKRHLYQGQCNCAYWHGVFGGIYLGHLRHATYKNLIIAQSLIEQKRGSHGIEARAFDFDRDGQDELVISNAFLNIFISPKLSGSIFELDYIPASFNLMDGISRRPEAYHDKIKAKFRKPSKIKSIHDLLSSKEKGLENFLIYDSYRRSSLLEHFLVQGLSLKDFRDSRYQELGDFINAGYSCRHKQENQSITAILQREGRINYNGLSVPLKITKELSLGATQTGFEVKYKLENLGDTPLELIFAVEFNISAQTQASPSRLCCSGEGTNKVYSLEEDVEAADIIDLQLQDTASGINCAWHFDKKIELWSHPLETVSASEAGFERNYQQTVLLPRWPIRLGGSWETRIYCNLSRI